eukprot:355142-Chlamydomonas_euryale.AAC.2
MTACPAASAVRRARRRQPPQLPCGCLSTAAPATLRGCGFGAGAPLLSRCRRTCGAWRRPQRPDRCGDAWERHAGVYWGATPTKLSLSSVNVGVSETVSVAGEGGWDQGTAPPWLPAAAACTALAPPSPAVAAGLTGAALRRRHGDADTPAVPPPPPSIDSSTRTFCSSALTSGCRGACWSGILPFCPCVFMLPRERPPRLAGLH